jgi:hypothetical protein
MSGCCYAKCYLCSVLIMLSVTKSRYADCHYTECGYAECRYAECSGNALVTHLSNLHYMVVSAATSVQPKIK